MLCRDQSSGALGSCVHPHRPWSNSHTASDGGEVAAVEVEISQGEKGSVRARAKGQIGVRNQSHFRYRSIRS